VFFSCNFFVRVVILVTSAFCIGGCAVRDASGKTPYVNGNSQMVTEIKSIEVPGNRIPLQIFSLRPKEGQAICWDFLTGGEVSGFEPVVFDYVNDRKVCSIPHGGEYGGCYLSPDGTRILSTCDDPPGSIILRDLAGQRVGIFVGQLEQKTDIQWFPGGNRFVATSKDLPIYVWEVNEGQPEEADSIEYHGHTRHYPSAVAISSDSKRVASGDWTGYLHVWDPGLGARLRRFPREIDPDFVPPPGLEDDYDDFCGAGILAVKFLAGNDQIVMVTSIGHVVVVDVRTRVEVSRYHQPAGTAPEDLVPVHHGVPMAIDVSPDGSRILYSMHTQPVRLLDTQTGALIAEFQGHTRQGYYDLNDKGQPGGVRAVAFTPDGDRAVTAGDDGTIRIWQLP